MKISVLKIKHIFITVSISVLILACSVIKASAFSPNSSDDLKNQLIDNFNNKTESFSIEYREASSLSSTEFSERILETVNQAQKSTLDSIYYSTKKITTQMIGKVGSLSLNFNVEYWSSKSQDEYVEKCIEEIIKEIIDPGMNIFEKEKAVYDYITSNVSYSRKLGDISHTAYSALKYNQAVCQGFAVLTNKMLIKAGIENRIISGIVNDREYHVWNIAKLDGKWYHLDTTWDASNPGIKNNTGNKFFNVTSEFMKSNSHKWQENDYPTASTVFDRKLSKNEIEKQNYENALKHILEVEKSKSKDDYIKAKKQISELFYSSEKIRLLKALDSINKLIFS